MQKVTILCVGKLKERFYIDAAAEYVKRLQRLCRLEVIELPESRLPDDPSPAELRRALQTDGLLVFHFHAGNDQSLGKPILHG